MKSLNYEEEEEEEKRERNTVASLHYEYIDTAERRFILHKVLRELKFCWKEIVIKPHNLNKFRLTN